MTVALVVLVGVVVVVVGWCGEALFTLLHFALQLRDNVGLGTCLVIEHVHETSLVSVSPLRSNGCFSSAQAAISSQRP